MWVAMRAAIVCLALCVASAACREPAASRDGSGRPARTADADGFELSAAGRAAFEALLEARRFTDGAIGEGGETPEEVVALRRLLAERDAAPALRRILADGSTGGRLYALCGLWFADPGAFHAAVRDFDARAGTIEYQSGCCIDPAHAVAELVRSAHADAVRLSGPDQRVKDWARARGMLAGGYRLDIAGGGIPDDLVMGGGWRER